MAKFSIERTSKKLSEISGEVHSQKGQIEMLGKSNEQLLMAITEIKGSGISEEAEKTATETLQRAKERNTEIAHEISDKLAENLKGLEDIAQETQEASDSNATQQKSLEVKKTILDHFGMGGLMEAARSTLEGEKSQLDSLMQTTIDIRKEADDGVRKADSL